MITQMNDHKYWCEKDIDKNLTYTILNQILTTFWKAIII